MLVSTTQLLDFLQACPGFEATRQEVSNATFSIFRRTMRLIAINLFEAETGDALEVANAFRRLLSENLTVPIPFDDSLVRSVDILGDAEMIGERWGTEVRNAFRLARQAVLDLQSVENPARGALRTLVQEFAAQSTTFRIACYRGAKLHFESLFPNQTDLLTPETFIHSVQDYRRAPIFDVLIKMGPLRSRGFGAVPDAIVNAPRFGRLEQIVWAGCHDEEGFGYDPVSIPSRSEAGQADTPIGSRCEWRYRTVRLSQVAPGELMGMPDQDDLEILADARKSDRETSRAVLVQVDGNHGILYPPLAQILSLSPDVEGPDSIASRLPGETLAVGMFVVVSALDDLDLGALRADEGEYSRLWKQRLIDAYTQDPSAFVRKLRAAGVNLQLLHSAVRHWSRPPTRVIHAPQQRQHFEALIQVLGIDHEGVARSSRAPWWQYAWREIASSRGEAIQTGMQGQELAEEELRRILVRSLPALKIAAQTADSFNFDIPTGWTLSGRLKFHRVHAIEEGFQVPSQDLRTITELSMVEQWRS